MRKIVFFASFLSLATLVALYGYSYVLEPNPEVETLEFTLDEDSVPQ